MADRIGFDTTAWIALSTIPIPNGSADAVSTFGLAHVVRPPSAATTPSRTRRVARGRLKAFAGRGRDST